MLSGYIVKFRTAIAVSARIFVKALRIEELNIIFSIYFAYSVHFSC